ncbi:hypothetical protein [Streptomyces sp. NPDC020983]
MPTPTQPESSEPEEPEAPTPTPAEVAEDHRRFNERWPNAQIR